MAMVQGPAYHATQDSFRDWRRPIWQFVGDPTNLQAPGRCPRIFASKSCRDARVSAGRARPSPEIHKCSMYSMAKGSKWSTRRGSSIKLSHNELWSMAGQSIRSFAPLGCVVPSKTTFGTAEFGAHSPPQRSIRRVEVRANITPKSKHDSAQGPPQTSTGCPSSRHTM